MLKLKSFVQLCCCFVLLSAQNLKADCTVFTDVKSAYLHSLGMRSDGSIWAWGHNNYGQVGNGTEVDVLHPVKVTSAPNASQCDAGFYHSLAVANNGTVWAWGNNQNGQLGNGTTTDSNTAIQVSTLTNVIAVAGGGFHSLALKSDGTVWSWGYNYYGQLGNGSRSQANTPQQVPGLSNVIAIDCGGYFSLALKGDGTVWAWGNNLYGQLGNGTTIDSYVPVQVPGLIDVTTIAAGALHALALQGDETLWSWGNNQYGQLGNNGTVNSSMPTQVLSLNQVASIACGGFHSLAMTDSAQLFAWGSNYYGGLGNGSTDSLSLIPVQVSNLQTATAIAGGYYHSLAVDSNGIGWGWGHNTFGEIGNDSLVNSNVPVQIDFEKPTVTATPASQLLCDGSTTAINLSSNMPSTISWTVATTNVSDALAGSGNTIAQELNLINPSLGGSVIYTVTATADACTGPAITVPITVNPVPIAVAMPASDTISSNQTLRINLASNVTGTTFCWTAVATDVTGSSSGCGNQIKQRLKLASGKSTGSVVYTVTPTANGCTGDPITVTVTVEK